MTLKMSFLSMAGGGCGVLSFIPKDINFAKKGPALESVAWTWTCIHVSICGHCGCCLMVENLESAQKQSNDEGQ